MSGYKMSALKNNIEILLEEGILTLDDIRFALEQGWISEEDAWNLAESVLNL